MLGTQKREGCEHTQCQPIGRVPLDIICRACIVTAARESSMSSDSKLLDSPHLCLLQPSCALVRRCKALSGRQTPGCTISQGEADIVWRYTDQSA